MGLRVRNQRTAGNATMGVVGTLFVHAAVVGVLVVTVESAPVFPPVYAVNLVAAPAPSANTRPAPEAVERPAEETPAPAPPTSAQEPPRPAPVPRQPAPQQREPAPRTQSTQTPAPGETPGTGNDAVTVKTPGLAFPYPDYLKNIYNQIYRRWERPLGSSLSAEVTFLIMRDGTVDALRFSRSSGNFSFDLSAQGAIEAAGNTKAFGSLPDGFEADVLLVSFYFSPARR